MTDKNLREISRIQWNCPNEKPSREDIQLGALLRIADGVELMARDQADRIAELDRTKKMCEALHRDNKRMARANAALRGVITKLKKVKR